MKQNHLIFILAFFLLILLMAAGCQPETDTSMLIPSPSPTTTPTNTATITQTPTKKPTRTPKPTKTITLTPSSTVDPRDFDASTIKTVTLATPAQCPLSDPSIEFDIGAEGVNLGCDRLSIDMDLFIKYLNEGVPVNTLLLAIQEEERCRNLLDNVDFVDVTGDTVEDIIINANFAVNVLACSNNQYRYIDIGGGGFDTHSVSYVDVVDVNNDGLLEIATISSLWGGTTDNLRIYTWDGNLFISLNTNSCFGTGGSFSVSFEDMDGNGTKEIILYHKGWTNEIFYDYLFPDRDLTIVCMWNGSEYLFTEATAGDPVYRLRAYTDAKGEQPEEALELYQRVIHDETLKWLEPGENKQLWWGIYLEEKAAEDPDIIYDPMYDFTFKQDIYEYPLLASASYYRMMLIYLQQNDIKNAETMLVILKDAYGPGKTGQHFTKMAEIVLDNYNKSGNLEQSCPEAVDYAAKNWDDITSPLTYMHMGYFFITPESWCPYLPEGYGEE